MIKLIINDIEYTKYLATGFSLFELLDEELDTGGITLFNTEIDEEFIPQSKVDIFNNDKLIKSILVGNDKVVLSSKKPLRYTHEIELIEITKKLERFFIDGKKFTQPIGNEYEKYTLLDVVMLLRVSVPLKHENEIVENIFDGKPYFEPLSQIIFNIPEETKNELKSVIAPEFNFKEKTLRECLDEVVSYIDCNVYLDGDDNLRLNKFNQLNDKISNDRFIEKTLERNIEQYSSNLENNVQNAVGEFDDGDVNVEIYPSKDIYVNSRSSQFVWDYPNSFIPTLNPIYKVKQVGFKLLATFTKYENGVPLPETFEEFTYDFKVKNVYEEAAARELEVAPDISTIINNPDKDYANAVLTYSYASKNIKLPFREGVFVGGSTLNFVLRGSNKENLIRLAEDYTGISRDDILKITIENGAILYYLDDTQGSEEYFFFTIAYPTNNNIESNEFASRVEYIPIKPTIRMNVERDNISETPYKSYLQTNQTLRIVDIDRYANKAKAKLNRLGLTEMMLVERVKDYNQALNLGDFTTDKFIVTQRELIFYKDFIICKYALHKAFNRVNKFVGLDQLERQWEIGEASRTIERNLNYDEYVEFDLINEKKDNNLSSFTLTNSAYNKIINTLNPNITTNTPLTLMTVEGKQTIDSNGVDYITPELILGFTKHVGGNQILLHTSIDSNYSIGERIEKIDRWFGNWLDRYEQRPTIYANEFARGNVFKFKFYDLNQAPQPKVLDDYVQEAFDIPILTFANEIQNKKMIEANLAIFKDNGENINLGIGYHFISNHNDMIIGNYITKKSLLINGSTNEDLKIRLYNDVWFTTRDKENVNHHTTYDEEELSVTIGEFSGLIEINNDLSLYDSYAIVDGNGNTFILVNDNKNLILVSFLRNRSGMFFSQIPTTLANYEFGSVADLDISFVIALNKILIEEFNLEVELDFVYDTAKNQLLEELFNTIVDIELDYLAFKNPLLSYHFNNLVDIDFNYITQKDIAISYSSNLLVELSPVLNTEKVQIGWLSGGTQQEANSTPNVCTNLSNIGNVRELTSTNKSWTSDGFVTTEPTDGPIFTSLPSTSPYNENDIVYILQDLGGGLFRWNKFILTVTTTTSYQTCSIL